MARVSFERVLVCLWSFNDWNRPKLKYASVLAQGRVSSTELVHEDQRHQERQWSRDRCFCKWFLLWTKRSMCLCGCALTPIFNYFYFLTLSSVLFLNVLRLIKNNGLWNSLERAVFSTITSVLSWICASWSEADCAFNVM